MSEQESLISKTLHGKKTIKGRKLRLAIPTPNGFLNIEVHETTNEHLHIIPPYNLNLPGNIDPSQLADDNPHPGGHCQMILGQPVINTILLSQAHFNSGKNDLYLVPTIYGFATSGTFKSHAHAESSSTYKTEVSPLRKLEQLLHKMYICTELLDESTLTVDEELAIKKLEDALTYDPVKQIYTTKLLFSHAVPKISNNYFSALTRLNSTLRSLKRNTKKLKTYQSMFHDFINDGYLEPVNDDFPSDPNKKCVYLGHHMVRKAQKDRIVIDPSMPLPNGWTLNDNLLPGPKLQQPLMQILLKFRVGRYAVTSDIKSMYLQIQLHPSHRDFARILWREPDEKEIRIYRWNAIAFGFRDAPFIAQTILRKHASKYKTSTANETTIKACDILLSQTYIDDISYSTNSIKEGVDLYTTIQSILKTANFQARKWTSNSPEILKRIPTDLKSTTIPDFPWETMLSPSQLETNSCPDTDLDIISAPTSTLGTKWEPQTDSLNYKNLLRITLKDNAPLTKKTVASIAGACNFDSLGLCSPFTIPIKECLKQTHVDKLDWKDQLPQELTDKVKKFVNSLETLQGLSFPRHTPIDESTTFHTFADASQLVGLGAAIYARTKVHGSENTWESHLLMASSAVHKLNGPATIARKELQALYIAAQLTKKVQNTFNLPSTKFVLWSDSTVVLFQLRFPRGSLRTFESNRIGFCVDTGFTFKKIPGSNNPADICSRGGTVQQLMSPLYQQGPAFLKIPEHQWNLPKSDSIPSDFREGLKQQATIHNISIIPQPDHEIPRDYLITVNHTTVVDDDLPRTISIRLYQGRLKVIDSNTISLDLYYSNYNKLLRVTATVMAAILPLKNRFLKKSPTSSNTVHSTTKTLLQKAERYWVKSNQIRHFKKDFERLAANQEVQTKKLKHLNPYISPEGIILIRGRLQNTNLPTSTKHPMLLPPCKLSKIILYEVHNKNYHCSPDTAIANLTDKFWILSSKVMSKQIQANCIPCRRFYSRQATQLMGDLPPTRASDDPPFTHVALDYFGPIHLLPTSKATYTRPYYGLVYKCQSTGGLGLDLVHNKSSYEFLMAFKRMAARFGLPATVSSDNAPEFIRGNEEIQQILAETNRKISQEGDKFRLSWDFIPPNASHMGGYHECAVRDAKRAIYSTIMRTSNLTYSEMSTIFMEVASILSDRPIAKLDDDSGGYITPNDLLLAKRTRALPEHFDKVSLPTPDNIRNRHKLRKNLLQQWFSVWRKTYLKNLQIRHKWTSKKPLIYVGQLVALESTLTKKHLWDTWVVHEVKIGRDGLVRSACLRRSPNLPKPTPQQIKTGNYVFAPCEYVSSMPLSRIYPLENSIPEEAIRIWDKLEAGDTSVLVSNHVSTSPCCQQQNMK